MRTSPLHSHLSPSIAPAKAFRPALRITALWGMFLCLCLAAPLAALAQTNEWRWMSGSSTLSLQDYDGWYYAPGVYGTQGVYAAGNVPGAREYPVSWTDAAGNLWLFGGAGYDSGGNKSTLNDLWEYNPTLEPWGQWRWMGGSSTAPNNGGQPGMYGTPGAYALDNVPGGRYGAVSWLDAGGNLWLFGGWGYDSVSTYGWLNDLWEYNPSTGQWRSMSGSSTLPCSGCGQPGVYGTQGVYAAGNIPGGRSGAVSWSDASGNLWLFGCGGYDSAGNQGQLNDLWEYSPSLGQWRWMGGSSTVSQYGVYGTQGVSAAGNVPGARDEAVSWSDASGNFWLFGGYGFDSAGNRGWLNDLWEYNLSTGQWRWMGGSKARNQSGVYGTQGVYAAGTFPGGRYGAVSWLDAGGNLWLSCGYGFDSAGNFGLLNDLWEYNPSTGQWRWMTGSSTLSLKDSNGNQYAAAAYGTQGVFAAGNVPGSRSGAVSWLGADGNLWLFGGWGYDSAGNYGQLNDLWEYGAAIQLPSVPPAITSAGSATFTVGTAGSFTVTATGSPVPTLSESGALPGGVTFDASTGVLSGAPVAGTAGTYPITFTASNGVSPNATQSFTLAVDAPPAITSAASATFIIGAAGSFTVVAAGYPPPTLSESGALPSGVTFNAATGALSGAPAAGTAGSYPISFSAGNGVSPNATQSFTLLVQPALAQPGEWRWMGGSSTLSLQNSYGIYCAPGVYGTQGVYAAGNVPGAREGAASWLDASGNLWLFGSQGCDLGGTIGDLNDLWEYNPSTDQWRWMGGSSRLSLQDPNGNYYAPGLYGALGVYAAGNVPGARKNAVSWSDVGGNLWLFGGGGYDSAGNGGWLNDLWEYSPSTGQWRWMGGSDTLPCEECGQPGVYGTQNVYAAGNVPGGRQYGVSWRDAGGNLWLFGGWGYDSAGNLDPLNDLWEYNPSTGQWRWMGGSSTVDQPGVYGTQGVYAAGNVPGSRDEAVSWSDAGGNLWLFGGSGSDSAGNGGALNDLWEYDPSLGQWRWMGGSSTVGSAGVYGTQGAYAAGNVPGGRGVAVSWSDAGGNLWLFGGYGYDSVGTYGDLNDLWQYNPSTGQWRWMGGSSTVGSAGVYGMQGVYAVGNVPGSRAAAVSWSDAGGNLWLFGGLGSDSAGNGGYLNDLWEYNSTAEPPPVSPFASCQFTLTSTTTTPATVTTLTNMPATAYYGDTVTISGCKAPNPAARLSYALAETGLKSTLVSGKVTFKATEQVAVTISAAAGGKYPAVSWTTATTTVNPRPVSIQAGSPTWTYGQTPPAAQAIKFALAAGSAPLAFKADQLPATGPYYTLTDSGNHNVTATPANQLPIGAYTITPLAAAIQANGYLPYYAITTVNGTLTVAPNNTSGSKGVVKPGTTSISLAGIEVGTSGTVTVLVTNMSGETLSLGASLPAGAPWSVSAAPACANTSGSGGVCSLTLTFAPTAAGAATTALTITAADANPDQFTGTTFTVAPVMLKLTAVN